MGVSPAVTRTPGLARGMWASVRFGPMPLELLISRRFGLSSAPMVLRYTPWESCPGSDPGPDDAHLASGCRGGDHL